MWHIYTMEYYSAIKRNEMELFVVRWMDVDIENGLEDTAGGGSGELGRSESSIDIYTLPNVK